MDLKNGSSSIGLGTDKLPDDMLIYLAKHFLKEQDCLALALSGSSYNFPSLYTANRKQLAIGRCFFLTPTSWTRFFKEYISPESIVTFDASHAYWLPAEVLVQSTVQMTNLQELFVEDTQVSLSHFPKIFEACQKIVKLSLTLDEKSKTNEELIEKASLDVLKRGFAKLTYLKLFNFTSDVEGDYSNEPWLRPLQVLKWCRDWVHLVIDMAYPEKDDLREFKRDGRELGASVANLLPRLGWMKNLKTLAILRKGNHPIIKGRIFVKRLLLWLLPEHKSLERLWFPVDYQGDILISSCSLFLKSLVTWPGATDEDLDEYLMNKDKRFDQLEHVSYIDFDGFGLHPHLKYVHGHSDFMDDKSLNEFCKLHPWLEQLHLDSSFIGSHDIFDHYVFEEKFGEGDWTLNLLKSLAYRCCRLSKKIIQHVMKGCPNIEELHIDIENDDRTQPMSIDYFSEFKFKHLRRLSITITKFIHFEFDGSYLPPIFKQCPKLESLQLSGGMAKPFFKNLTLCLPSAANLRDLRLEWQHCDNYDIFPLYQFMEALGQSSNLQYFERLVLKVVKECVFDRNPIHFAEFQEFIVPFAKGMTHLVALGIFGFPFHPSAAEEIRRRLSEEVVPHREAFWFHLSENLPRENDTSVPRIHYDEIVAPRDPIDAPPKF